MNKAFIQVLGPTGVGKSRVAVSLAKRFNGEVISADAFQVYKGFDVGTDKTRERDREGIPHHLIDIIDDGSQFNAWQFLQLSFQVSEEMVSRGKIPVVCGGTALYLHVQIHGIFPEKKDDGTTRRQLKIEAEEKGIEALWKELHSADPEYAAKISPIDRIRIIRGLEMLRLNHAAPTELFARNVTPFVDYSISRVGLLMERKELYDRVDRRVDRMIVEGFVDEVRTLRQKHPPDCPPFRGVGYREICLHLDGIMDLTTTVELIKRNSRRLAKRQMSWFRQENDISWFHPEETDKICQFIEARTWKKP